MKYSAVIAAAMAAVASAQNISIFPACSLPCIESAVTNSTNCQLTDYACICSNMATLTTAATPCVVEKCGVDVATNQVLPATKEFCANVSSSSSSSAVGSTSMTTVSSSSMASSSSAMVSTTCSTTSTVAVVTTSMASNSTASATKTASPTPVVTAGAASLGSLGAAAMLMIAAFAL